MSLDLSRLPEERRAHVEANSRWALIYPWADKIEHPKGDFRVDERFYSQLKAFMDDHRGVYYTPFAANHDSPGTSPEGLPDDARNKGRIIDLRKAQRGIEALIYFGKGLAEQFDAGLIDSLSPSHYTRGIRSPYNGKFYETALREVSSVVVRHLKNMPGASPWYQLDEQELGAQPLTSLAEEQDMSTQEALTHEQITKLIQDGNRELAGKVTTLSETVERLLKGAGNATQNSEATPEQQRIKELETQLKDAQRKSACAEARAKVLTRYPKLDEAAATTLSEAMADSADGGAALLDAFGKAQPGVTENAEMGAPGAPATGAARVTWEAAMAEAVRAGHKANSTAAIAWIGQKHPALLRG